MTALPHQTGPRTPQRADALHEIRRSTAEHAHVVTLTPGQLDDALDRAELPAWTTRHLGATAEPPVELTAVPDRTRQARPELGATCLAVTLPPSTGPDYLRTLQLLLELAQHVGILAMRGALVRGQAEAGPGGEVVVTLPGITVGGGA